MEKLIEKLKDMIAKESDESVKIGLRMALLEVYNTYSEQLSDDILKSLNKIN